MAEHDRDAGMHPTNQLLSLPAELIRACLAHLTPVDALRACCTCRELKTESASDGVWKELYRRRWPQWTLLASARPSGVTWLVTFKARYCHEVTLIVPEDHVFLMSGHCGDLYDNNTTPMLAAMCRAPRDFERIGVDHFSLLGEVQYSRARSTTSLARRPFTAAVPLSAIAWVRIRSMSSGASTPRRLATGCTAAV